MMNTEISRHFNGTKWIYQVKIGEQYLRDAAGRTRSFSTSAAAQRCIDKLTRERESPKTSAQLAREIEEVLAKPGAR